MHRMGAADYSSVSSQRGKYVRAIYDFDPSSPEELLITSGDVIKLEHRVDKLWSFGQKLVDHATGQFPSNFVEDIVLPTLKDPKERWLIAVDTFTPEMKDDLPFQKGDVIILESKVDESWGRGRCNRSYGMFPLNYAQELPDATAAYCSRDVSSPTVSVVKATMSLKAQLDHELSFDVGDVIEVTEFLDEGWAKGKNGSLAGIFPLSFTQPYVSNGCTPRPEVPHSKTSYHHHRRPDDMSNVTKTPSPQKNYGLFSNRNYPILSQKPIQIRKSIEGTALSADQSKIYVHRGRPNRPTPPANPSAKHVTAVDAGVSLPKVANATSRTSTSSKNRNCNSNEVISSSKSDYRIVIDDFAAVTDFDIPVRRGDVVKLVKQVNADWCEATDSAGRSGFVPASCLRTISNANLNKRDEDQTPVSLVKRSSAIRESNSSQYTKPAVISNTKPKSLNVPKPNAPAPKLLHKPATPKMIHRTAEAPSKNNTYPHTALSNSSTVDVLVLPAAKSLARKTPSSVCSSESQDSLSSNLTSTSIGHVIATSDTISEFDPLSKGDTPPQVPLRSTSQRKAARKAPPPPVKNHPAGSDTESTFAPICPPLPATVACASKPKDIRKMTPAERKTRIEKVRSEIEEYCRTKKEMEAMYSKSFDGKERLEISENKELLMAKLKRLQKELHDLIDDNSNIYEHLDECQVDGPMSEPRAPTPPPVETLEELMQKRSVKRLHVVRELINTEKDFLNDVNITIEDIMKPLLEHDLPPEIRADTLFGNIESIRDFSASLVCSLEDLEYSVACENNPDRVNVGKIFIDHIPRMKEVYKVYCRNHDDATALLEKYEEDTDFQLPVQECLNNVKAKVNAFDLGSFLIKPVQRILKYPLLLQELLKLTDAPEPTSDSTCHADLITAVKMIQDVANLINEEKRKKDLVRKYRRSSQQTTLSGKMSRLSFHSVKKKSARMTQRLVTGLGTPETIDDKFNEQEQKFKAMERAMKAFIQNCETFLTRYRDWLKSEYILMEDLSDLFSADRVKMVGNFKAAVRRAGEQMFRNFHDQLQLRVLSPLSSLLVQFKGPQAIIDKRFDKLLDFESSQRSSESKEKIQMARNVYEALNQQLLDELPILIDLSNQMLIMCMAIFVELLRKLQSAVLKELTSVIENTNQTVTDGVQPCDALNKEDIIAKFTAAHEQVVRKLSTNSIVPPSFGALTHSKPHPPSEVSQGVKSSLPTRDYSKTLLAKYPASSLYAASKTHRSTNNIDLSCNEQQLFGVIKKQDPMGNTGRWFVDSGETQGFLPALYLRPFDPPVSLSPTSPQTRNFSIVSPTSPTPQHRPPSVASNTSNELCAYHMEGTSPVSRRQSASPYSLRQGLSPTGGSQAPGLDLDDAFEEEEEMLDDAEYGEVGGGVKKKEYFMVEYDFTSRSSLELSVKPGDILTQIVPHDLEGNAEWWLMANTTGKQGYVPATYMTRAEYL